MVIQNVTKFYIEDEQLMGYYVKYNDIETHLKNFVWLNTFKLLVFGRDNL